MGTVVRGYKLVALAVFLVILDLVVLALVPGLRYTSWSALGTLAGLDSVLVFAWFMAVALGAKLRSRQPSQRLDFDYNSYWAKREAKPKN